MDWIQQAPPLEVHGSNVAKCYGGAVKELGHPVEYIILNDTSAEQPAVCKYCGNKFYQGHHH